MVRKFRINLKITISCLIFVSLSDYGFSDSRLNQIIQATEENQIVKINLYSVKLKYDQNYSFIHYIFISSLKEFLIDKRWEQFCGDLPSQENAFLKWRQWKLQHFQRLEEERLPLKPMKEVEKFESLRTNVHESIIYIDKITCPKDTSRLEEILQAAETHQAVTVPSQPLKSYEIYQKELLTILRAASELEPNIGEEFKTLCLGRKVKLNHQNNPYQARLDRVRMLLEGFIDSLPLMNRDKRFDLIAVNASQALLSLEEFQCLKVLPNEP